ncbi:MAG: NAD(P)H-hydrate dehydratase, partial [Firmicutes bacterium]|nr:NAD(P)H-hydrate dehydratase [Bacillota bacterium]
GPGMGKTLMTAGIVERVLNSFSGKLLIDADGLNVIASREKLADDLAEFPGQAVITPHGGEAARLLGLTDPVSTDREERVRAVTALSEVFGMVSVLKGKGTLVKGEGQAIYMNTTGNPGMATAGSGDVLTGMMTALMGRGLSAKEAAVCGVYLHGLAGDLAARELGEESLMARDIIRGIPGAFRICRG